MVTTTTVRYIIKIPKASVKKIQENKAKCNDIEKTEYCWILATDLFDAIDIAKDDENVFIPSICGEEENKLDKKMRKNLLKNTKSREKIESIIKQKRK